MIVALLGVRHRAPGSDSRLARALLWVGLVVTLFGLGASPAVAADEPAARFAWDEVSVTVQLQDDGTARVREHDTVQFTGGPFRQGFREIPLAALDDIRAITVAEVGSGPDRPYQYVPPAAYSRNTPSTYTFQKVGTTMRIQWSFPPTSSASRAWVIAYTAYGVLRVYADAEPPYQEMWWIGADRDLTRGAPVNRAMLIMILPRPVDPAEVIAEGNGTPFGGEDGQTWFWRKENLAAGDSLEASLRFPPLIAATKPAWQETFDRQVAREGPANLAFLGLALLTGVGGSVGLLATWWTRGRDPEPGVVPERLAEPPDDTPPGVVGALLDEEVDHRDYVATLVDLGRRGVVRISTRTQPVRTNNAPMTVTLLKPEAEMAPFERALLSAFFAKTWWRQAQVHLPLNDPESTSEGLQQVENLLYGELVQRGYFASPPPETREWWRYGGIGLWALAIAVLLLALPVVSSIVWPLLLSIVLVALGTTLFVVSRHMPQKTRAGAEAAARWRAFRNVMEAADRLDAVPVGQDRFSRELPYAVAFGIEDPWINAFARTQPTGGAAPAWSDLANVDVSWLRSAGRAGASVPLPDVDLPALGGLQNVSSLASASIQASSDTLFDMFNEMGEAFRWERAAPVARSVSSDGGEIALRLGVQILLAVLSGGKGQGSGGGGGGFS